MLDTIIRRTYNRHGDCDYLIRMDSTPSMIHHHTTGDHRNAFR